MTKAELSQLYYLNKEIKQIKRRILELETAATSTTSGISGMPHGSGVSDKIGNFAAELADLQGLLELNMKKCFFELNRLTRFISGVEDSEMRQILTIRYINGETWQKVAFDLGYHDEQVPRKKHDKFLRENEKQSPRYVIKFQPQNI